jgi:hypothetical protein
MFRHSHCKHSSGTAHMNTQSTFILHTMCIEDEELNLLEARGMYKHMNRFMNEF